MAALVQLPPIAKGYPYSVRIDVSGALSPFPLGCSLKAGVADYVGGPLLGELTTGDGSIAQIDANTIQLDFSAALTALLGNTSCVVDLVRTDVVPEQWLDVQLTLPVVTPVTPP